ncbi:MAG: ABC transporter ATP-binding protein [Balneolales bacterium]
MSKHNILSATGIFKDYPGNNGSGPLTVLNDVNIGIRHSAVTTIIGSSGSGKSTLLHILGGLDRPTKGQVLFNGVDLNAMSENELAAFRNKKIGFVFQFHHLLPEFTALENVFMPGLISGGTKDELNAKASGLLRMLGLGDRLEHRPSQLSGGEQQRVAVARSLMNDPDVIMADEPTGNLDDRNTKSMLDILFMLKEERNLSLVLVTHDYKIAGRSDFVHELTDGRLHKSAGEG